MTLRLLDLQEARNGPAYGPESWLPVRLTLFMQSDAAASLKRALWSYLAMEVQGRSFLVAGHRGAGKTALVLRTVADVTDELLEATASAPARQARTAQRPLLVKLHGPSLLSGALPATGVDIPVKGDGTPDRNLMFQGAMVAITTALYRALVSEVARRYRIHAAGAGSAGPGSRHPRRSEVLELASRLRLELDRAPQPDVLRALWDRLGRLERGVLWPDTDDGGAPDQGMREIVAVATAAQAFRVCTGVVTGETATKDASSNAQTRSAGGGLDAKEGLNRLLALASAAGVAGGAALASAQPGLAGAAGLGALLSAGTLAWTSSRTRKRDETEDYKFIRDFTLGTLERDLPEVILRVRAAGLAPVFMVDELDKLERHGDIDLLIGRLKNLTTDYGFFCFLTNRDYFELLRARIRKGAYTREYTYFSDMLFVAYRPEQMMRYVLQILRPDPFAADRGDPAEAADWMSLALNLLHAARLNSIALMRGISAAFDERGVLRRSAALSLPRSRIAAAIQITVNLAVAEQDLTSRLDADPLFGQILMDAAYRLSNAWEAGEASVDLGPEALRGYLQTRTDAGASGEVPTTMALTDDDLAFLSETARRIALTLTSFADFGSRTSRQWTPAVRAAVFDGTIPSAFAEAAVAASARLLAPLEAAGESGFLQEMPGSPGRFAFKFGRNGERRPAAGSGPHAWDPEGLARAVTDILRLLDGIGMDVLELARAGVLGAVADRASTDRALSTLAQGATGERQDSATDSLAVLSTLRDAFVEGAPTLRWILPLASGVDLSAKAGAGAALKGVLRHLSRHETVDGAKGARTLCGLLEGRLRGLPFDVQLPPPLGGAPEVCRWADEMLAACADIPSGRVSSASNDFARWRQRLLRHLEEPGDTFPADWGDLLEAAIGQGPGAVFRRPLSGMTGRDWSALALASAPTRVAPSGRARQPWIGDPPPWCLAAALQALRFDGAAIRQVLDDFGSAPTAEDREVFAAAIGKAPRQASDGRIRMIVGTDLPPDALSQQVGGVLVVHSEEIEEAAPFVVFLRNIGPLEIVGTEDGDETTEILA